MEHSLDKKQANILRKKIKSKDIGQRQSTSYTQATASTGFRAGNLNVFGLYIYGDQPLDKPVPCLSQISLAPFRGSLMNGWLGWPWREIRTMNPESVARGSQCLLRLAASRGQKYRKYRICALRLTDENEPKLAISKSRNFSGHSFERNKIGRRMVYTQEWFLRVRIWIQLSPQMSEPEYYLLFGHSLTLHPTSDSRRYGFM